MIIFNVVIRVSMTNLTILPNLLNMICKSSSLVTGFSLHTNKTFSGGATSAEGKSPTISRIVARA